MRQEIANLGNPRFGDTDTEEAMILVRYGKRNDRRIKRSHHAESFRHGKIPDFLEKVIFQRTGFSLGNHRNDLRDHYGALRFPHAVHGHFRHPCQQEREKIRFQERFPTAGNHPGSGV